MKNKNAITLDELGKFVTNALDKIHSEDTEKEIEKCQKKIWQMKGGAFGQIPSVGVYVSPEELKEIERLEKRIELLNKPLV